jgi:WD40 repeat protein
MNSLKPKNQVTPNDSKFDVFISYSRDDEAFVRRLYDALNEKQRRAWVDWKGIPPTADWMAEVFSAVESADNFVFVLSQASLASEVCGREVEHAVKCRKRLVPFVWGDIDDERVPTELRRLNWIICRNDADFPRAASSLLEALTLNLEWVREHTRLLVRAVDWRDGGADASLLLRGSDLKEAEQWLAQGVDEEPKPTELHRDYVLASRTQETRRGRRTLSVVAAGMVLAIGLAVVAWVQRQNAKTQEQAAKTQANIAEERRKDAERENITALTNESNASFSLGKGLEALIASVKAGKKLQQERTLVEDSTAVHRILAALRRAINDGHERNRFATGHFRGATHLAFSPDDQSIYSVGGGGDIKRWGLDGKLLSTFETELSAEADGCTSIQNFALSPDGKELAALGNAGQFAVWDAAGKPTGGFKSEIYPPGDGMCTGIMDSKINFAARTVTIREAEQESVWSFDGAINQTVVAASSESQTGRVRVANSDGSLVANSADDDTISVRRRDGTTVLRIPLQQNATFSHRSGKLATVSADVDNSIIHIWDLTGSPTPASNHEKAVVEPKKKLKLGDRNVNLDYREASDKFERGRFEGVISPDGKLAAITTSHNGQNLALWRISSAAALVAEFDADQIASADFSEAIQSLAFSYDNQLLASGGSDGTVKLWDSSGKLVRKIVAHSLYTNVRFSPDGQLLLTWAQDPRDREVAVKLWTIDGQLLDSLSTEAIKDAWFSADGKWIFATAGSQQKAWSMDLDQLLQQGCAALNLYLANPTRAEDAKICS